MAQVGGTAFIRLGSGASYSSDGKFEIKINQSKRDGIVDASGVVHYTESAVASTISGSLICVPGLNPQAVADMENVTVLVECKNGRTAMLSNAFQSSEMSESTESGLVSFEFTGQGRWVG